MTNAIGERVKISRSPHWKNKGYRSLAAAIIKQAAVDAREPDIIGADARRWLLDVGFDWLATLDLGIDWDLWEKWVNLGCPDDINKDRGTESAQNAKKRP